MKRCRQWNDANNFYTQRPYNNKINIIYGVLIILRGCKTSPTNIAVVSCRQ